jgi:hypothetical protein
MADLQAKFAQKEEQLVRRLREVTRKQRLGIGEEEVPTELARNTQTIQFNPKALTTEERYGISQDLNDPEKFEDARDRLLESALGVKPEVLRTHLTNTQLATQQIMARQNAEIWMSSHPEFYVCSENISIVCDWMTKAGLEPSVKNFEYAQSRMSEAGLLLSSPIVREVPPVTPVTVVERVPEPQPPVDEPTRISEVPLPQSSTSVSVETRQSHVPSGLNNRVAPITSGNTPVSATAALTLRDIDAMPSEEYKRHLQTNPEFVKRVNELYAAVPPRPSR